MTTLLAKMRSKREMTIFQPIATRRKVMTMIATKISIKIIITLRLKIHSRLKTSNFLKNTIIFPAWARIRKAKRVRTFFNIMKRFLTTIFIFCAVCSMVSAQSNKCKPTYSAEDKFTKDKYVLYGGKMTGGFLDGSTYIYLYVGTENGNLYLQMSLEKVISQPDAATITKLREESKINKGAKLYLVLENGESLQFTATGDSKYDENTTFGYSITTSAAYKLTPEDFKKLATSLITNYRLEFSGNVSSLQDKVGKGKAKDLLEKFACALANLKYK